MGNFYFIHNYCKFKWWKKSNASAVIPTNTSLSEGLKRSVYAATIRHLSSASSGQLAAKINYQPPC